MLNWNVGNINGPCLIWSINYSISQKIWTYFGLLHSFRKIHFRINRTNIHFIHITSCLSTSHMISSSLQLGGHLSCTPGWVICMEMIDNLFTSQFFIGCRRAFVINTCTIDIKQFCADRSRDFFSRQKVLD